MGRIRSIKPSFFTDEDIADLPVFGRLLFIGLFTLADKDGRLEDRPRSIKAQIFPYDGDVEVDELLEQLHNSGFITRYSAIDEDLIQVNNFVQHQRINGDEAKTESIYPEPSEITKKNRRSRNEACAKQSRSSDEAGTKQSRSSDEAGTKQSRSSDEAGTKQERSRDEADKTTGREGKGRERKGREQYAAPALPKPPAVENTRSPLVSKTETDELVLALADSFDSRNLGEGEIPRYSNYPKESKGLKTLATNIRALSPTDYMALAKQLLEVFWDLTRSGDKFWHSQPFLPSVMAADGIFPRIASRARDSPSPENSPMLAMADAIDRKRMEVPA